MSQQRVHVPDASLPSPGFARAFVPPLQRYYQGTATSCRPSRRVSFPSLGGTTGSRIFRSRRRCVRQRRAWGWSLGIPFRAFFRGDDRISQVPGEPQFPFAHGLRPRPADASLTDCGTLAWPPLSERRRRRTRRLSRLNSMAFGLAAYVSRDWLSADRARLASRCWSGSPGRAFTRRVPPKGFQLTSCVLSSFSKLLGTTTFSSQRCPSHHACKSPSQIPNVAHHITPAKVRRKYQTVPITSRLQKSVANTNRRFRRAAAFRLLRGVVRTPAPSSPARIACIEFPRN